jgi:hypothetical protein
MKKSKLLFAGLVLSTSPAFAADPAIPEVCKTAAYYSALTFDISYTDGTWSDKYNPKKLTLKKDYKKYPITSIQFLGNCDDGTSTLKESWCQVGGGSPDVYQVEVSKAQSKTDVYPIANVIVTYNRGGCWVDEATSK